MVKKLSTERINIGKYTLSDLINYYSSKINNLSKKERNKIKSLLNEDLNQRLDMNSPPEKISTKLLKKFIWGKNFNNPHTDH